MVLQTSQLVCSQPHRSLYKREGCTWAELGWLTTLSPDLCKQRETPCNTQAKRVSARWFLLVLALCEWPHYYSAAIWQIELGPTLGWAVYIHTTHAHTYTYIHTTYTRNNVLSQCALSVVVMCCDWFYIFVTMGEFRG